MRSFHASIVEVEGKHSVKKSVWLSAVSYISHLDHKIKKMYHQTKEAGGLDILICSIFPPHPYLPHPTVTYSLYKVDIQVSVMFTCWFGIKSEHNVERKCIIQVGDIYQSLSLYTSKGVIPRGWGWWPSFRTKKYTKNLI